MSRSSQQKLKILYLMRMFFRQTDEAHPVSMEQILSNLSSHGISAERKSVYDDIETLRTFGLDIITVKSTTTKYYLGNRLFELPELKLLVDSVQASKFFTEKKTLSLIKKIVSLSSIHEAELLNREVYVQNRIKSMNESIYYNVDILHTAIARNRKINFQYYEYTLSKTKRLRRNGQRYVVSPYALIWDDENYYLIAYDAQAGIFKHYRADKMSALCILEEPREGQALFSRMDMSAYTKRSFSMFGGKEEPVTIQFSNSLIGVVIDRFGKDIVPIRTDEAHFQITVPIMVSPQFFAWIFGLRGQAQILSPPHVVDQMRAQLQAVAQAY